jgi:hypothetical protein
MKNSVIHEKLGDSHGPCKGYVGIFIILVKNSVIHETLGWFMKNSVIHEKLADDFLVERNRADIWLHFHY